MFDCRFSLAEGSPRWYIGRGGIMSEKRIFTEEEELAIALRAVELRKQGKVEESMALQKQLPLPPYLAMFGKKYFGAECLIKTGWNLSAAEEEFGPDWLTK
jgi:hypothetical protein